MNQDGEHRRESHLMDECRTKLGVLTCLEAPASRSSTIGSPLGSPIGPRGVTGMAGTPGGLGTGSGSGSGSATGVGGPTGASVGAAGGGSGYPIHRSDIPEYSSPCSPGPERWGEFRNTHRTRPTLSMSSVAGTGLGSSPVVCGSYTPATSTPTFSSSSIRSSVSSLSKPNAIKFSTTIGQRRPPSSLTFISTPSPGEKNLFSSGHLPEASVIEQERKLKEIMSQTGILCVKHQRVPTKLDDLELVGDLGNGTCGHVVKMRHKPSGQILAVKQMRRTGNSDENKRIIMDLDVVLKSNDCEQIVLCLGCFITDSEVWICMELMSTCFDKLIKQFRQPIPEPICGKVAVSTLKALNYLKETHRVIHRDVKPSNILLDSNGRIKLCDFGISGRLVDSKAKTRSAGCAAYMAPERINPPNPSKPDYDIRADVWSLGITLVELATGHFPYRDCKTDFELLTKVLEDDPPLLPRNQDFSPEFCSFVRDCLMKNYRDRPKYKKLLQHPFILKYEVESVDVGSWYRRNEHEFKSQATYDAQPNRSFSKNASRSVSGLETPNERSVFKPQPSPRVVRSWRPSAVTPSASDRNADGVFKSHPKGQDPQSFSQPGLYEKVTRPQASLTSRGPSMGGGFSHMNSQLSGSINYERPSQSYREFAASTNIGPSQGPQDSSGMGIGSASRKYLRNIQNSADSKLEFTYPSSGAATRSERSPNSSHLFHEYRTGIQNVVSSEQPVERKQTRGPVPEQRRPTTTSQVLESNYQPERQGRSYFPNWRSFSGWNWQSPITLRRQRTSSSDRSSGSNFDTSKRLLPAYRSWNEKDEYSNNLRR
ncbi:hypothetical protein TCAL_09945 [Tigriopus californicus]|uniref:mitogen-activated protein kinase kinase n=1 Tax=Tigriopus californicus TaxID=6832 RepID=A0A553PDW7_TIGCA|nr:uncharacterized protein LOC131893126 [Tigriopus californicus]TRY75876.1 hypothetical protein TCAL_09945 [Tigriopus californicus]|eukprot:TCALIF_09945-PA protein Name:"Similar to Map2k7 Dual specificity mitogen-activated protein kinase kinase 7 (Rattus norvegicus)" AED:0.25 eAED:0.26 QI:0/-1/0/1/-1/1/1/0/822